MKNYMEKRNCGNNGCRNGVTFWNDPFEDFFKPMFYENNKGDMKTDIKETEKGYELSVDMPGFDKKDISVTLNNGYLTVEAKRHENVEDKKNYIRRERSYSCSRSYYVGDDIKESDIKAKYENGTLALDVPKKEEKELHSGNIVIE